MSWLHLGARLCNGQNLSYFGPNSAQLGPHLAPSGLNLVRFDLFFVDFEEVFDWFLQDSHCVFLSSSLLF